jgi:hypothetical protein
VPNPQVQFRAMPELLRQLETRVGTSYADSTADVARRDLERYYALLARVRPIFSMNEAMMMADAANGTLWDEFSAQLLWAEISDAAEEGLAEKWGVEAHILVGRLKMATPLERMAIVDALERAWSHREGWQLNDMRERLVEVGLVAPDEQSK